jgi:hypothetical protein
MSNIILNSGVLRLVDFPKETTKIMILYDERGWAIRCYDADDQQSTKITTMVPDRRMSGSENDVTLVRKESL